MKEINKNNNNNCGNNNNKIETYTGLTKNTFKSRYDGQNSIFNNRDQSGKTTLTAHIWKLKDKGADYDISWSNLENWGGPRGLKFGILALLTNIK